MVAGVVAITALVALLTSAYWLLIPLAYGFGARVLTGPTLSPLGRFATDVAAPRLGPPRYVPGPPVSSPRSRSAWAARSSGC